MHEQIRNLFATILDVKPEQIHDDTCPSLFERWDSLQHLILVAGFEEEFGIELEPEEAVDMFKDFGTFKAIVLQKLAATR